MNNTPFVEMNLKLINYFDKHVWKWPRYYDSQV